MRNIGFTATLLLFLLSTFHIFAQGKELNYNDDTTKLKGYYVASGLKSASKKTPGVIILHAWMGLSEHEKTTANKLGALGFNALAADVYGENVKATTYAEAAALSGYYKKNFEIYQSRIKAAMKALIAQGTDPENIVIIGYCFGGTGAIEAARAGLKVKGIVSFHGGLAKDTARSNVTFSTKILILHGADDPFVQDKDVKAFQQELRAGAADWQMIYYSNAVHAFTDPAAGNDNSKGAAYNKIADERSWQAFISFLHEVSAK